MAPEASPFVFAAIVGTAAAAGDQVGAAIDRRNSASAAPVAAAPPLPSPTPQGLGQRWTNFATHPGVAQGASITAGFVPIASTVQDGAALAGFDFFGGPPVSGWNRFWGGVGFLLPLVSGMELRLVSRALNEAIEELPEASKIARQSIVFGENMEDRVIPYAKKIGARWYRATSKDPTKWMKNNIRAAYRWMQEGLDVIDIGPDKVRRALRGPSESYEMEQKIFKRRGYPVIWDPQP